jgi:hypothetical protein
MAERQTWTLAFVDREREAAFRAAFATDVRGFYRLALAAVVLLWSASVGFDLQAPPDERLPLYVIRFGLVTPIVLAALAVGFASPAVFLRWWQVAANTAYAAVQGGVVGLVALAPGEMSQLVVGGFLLTVLIGAALDLTRAVALVAIAAAGAIAMIAAMAWSPHVGMRALVIDALWIVVAVVGVALIAVALERGRRQRFIDRELLERERARTEALLANLLPPPIAERLKEGPRVIADRLDDVTVLFADLKGYTVLSTRETPDRMVNRLDRVFSAFDEIAREHGLEKIKTIGRRLHGGGRRAGAARRSRGGRDRDGQGDDRAAARPRAGARAADRPGVGPGGGGRHRSLEVLLRSVGRDREPRQPHGVSRHRRAHPDQRSDPRAPR